MRIPGACDGGGETTVLAHLNWLGGTMGGKSSDLSGVYCCAPCHDVIDVRNMEAWMQHRPHIDWHKGRALVETHARMVAKGLLMVRGAK